MNNQLGKHSIIRNTITLIASSALSYAASAAAVFITARALGAEIYGAYVSCFALTKITSILFSLGLDNWLLREGGYDKSSLGRHLYTVLRTKFVFGIIWLFIVLALSFVLDGNKYPPMLLAAVALTTWFESAAATLITGYKSLLLNKIAASVTSISGALLLITTLGLVISGESRLQIYVGLRLVIALASAVFLILVSRNYFFLERSIHKLSDFIRDVWPYIISEGLFLVYTYADVIIISSILGQKAAGVYGPATSIISTIYLVPQAVFSVLLPVFSGLYAEHNPKMFSISRNALFLSGLLGICLFAVTYLFGPPFIVTILGDDFAPSMPVLQILSINLILKSISLSAVAILTAAGFQKSRLVAQAAAAVLNVILNLLFIRIVGLQGVAWIYIFSELIVAAGYLSILPKVSKKLENVSIGY